MPPEKMPFNSLSVVVADLGCCVCGRRIYRLHLGPSGWAHSAAYPVSTPCLKAQPHNVHMIKAARQIRSEILQAIR